MKNHDIPIYIVENFEKRFAKIILGIWFRLPTHPWTTVTWQGEIYETKCQDLLRIIKEDIQPESDSSILPNATVIKYYPGQFIQMIDYGQ